MSGARATGQILKIINREGKIGVRSQNPGTMYVSSIGSNCFPVHPTCLRQLPYPLSSVGHIQSPWRVARPGRGTPVGWQWSPPCALPRGLAASQSGGERSPEAPPTTFPHPHACPQRGSWLCGQYQPPSSSRKPSPCPHLGSGTALHQVLARLAFALILPLEPTHMLGSPTLLLPWKRLWPHPQGSDVGKRGS